MILKEAHKNLFAARISLVAWQTHPEREKVWHEIPVTDSS